MEARLLLREATPGRHLRSPYSSHGLSALESPAAFCTPAFIHDCRSALGLVWWPIEDQSR